MSPDRSASLLSIRRNDPVSSAVERVTPSLLSKLIDVAASGSPISSLRDDAPYWHTKKPDRDNLEKAVLDVLTQLGMWGDDCQVCGGEVLKRYVVGLERPGAIIQIASMTTP